MSTASDSLWDDVAYELEVIWAAHAAVKLDGFMALYTRPDQSPWRSKDAGIAFWFGPSDIPAAIAELRTHYNDGALPNSPMLLNPVVHKKNADGSYTPLGSGIIWSTAFCLGVDFLKPEQQERIEELGVFSSVFHRAQNKKAGLKMLAFSPGALPPLDDGISVKGNFGLYEVTDIESEQYYNYYLLSGLSYLSLHGAFLHPAFRTLFPEGSDPCKLIKSAAQDAQKFEDAAYCWKAYDKHHTLYNKFGIDPAHVEDNLKYFDLCARDIKLYDATGPMRLGSDESFEFVVPGWLPRGSVTLLAAAGGTGKSSVAHELCVMAAIDYTKKDKTPHWLGQPLNTKICKGLCIYFSGEDGPAIINARGKLFDPEGRSNRLMFQRINFGNSDKGDELTFAQFLKTLHKLPEVSILVVDPARKYLNGNEDDSNVVSEFFEAIEEFAIQKNAAVVVVHHLQKGANPKSVREVLDELRGSQVFIDRPRVVLGMYREGPHTMVGLAKCNIPPNLGMVMGERVFVRNPKNLRLIWLPGEAGVRRAFLPEEELEQIQQESELQILLRDREAEKKK